MRQFRDRNPSAEFINMIMAAATLQTAVVNLGASAVSDEKALDDFDEFIRDGFISDFNEFMIHLDRPLRLAFRNVKPKKTGV